LDAGGTPGDEGGEVAFADAEEGFVDLRVIQYGCDVKRGGMLTSVGSASPMIMFKIEM
jgi:hypothetical protein